MVGGEERDQVFIDHGFEFARRTRQDHIGHSVYFLQATDSEASDILNGGKALDDLSLALIVGSSGILRAGSKKVIQPLTGLFIKDQTTIQKFGQGLLGQVIFGWPQTATQDHQIAALAGGFQDRQEPLFIVSHGGMEKDINPQLREFFGQELGIGIDNLPRQNLCPHCYQLRSHRTSYFIYSNFFFHCNRKRERRDRKRS